MKKIVQQPTLLPFALLLVVFLFSQVAFGQTAVINFDFTDNTTFSGCSGDDDYASNSGNETVNSTGIPPAATVNSITFSSHYGKSGFGSSGTINFLLNGHAIGTFSGINSSCNNNTINSINTAFFNVDGPNVISFTSSGGGTRRVYNGTLTVNYTPCTPPSPPGVDGLVEYCLNETSDQLTASGSGLLWYTTPTGGSASAIAPVPATDVTGTSAFYVSQTVGCESNRAEIDVTVNPLPSASVVGFTNITCFGANDGTITISGSNGTAPYSYSVNNGAGWTSSDTDPFVFPGLAPNVGYQIRVKDDKGCVSKEVH